MPAYRPSIVEQLVPVVKYRLFAESYHWSVERNGSEETIGDGSLCDSDSAYGFPLRRS